MIDTAVLDYFSQVGLSVEETKREIAETLDHQARHTRAQRKEAERQVHKAAESLARVERDYLEGRLAADDWTRFKAMLAEELTAARAELDRLAQHEARLTVQDASVEEELLEYLNDVRAAVVGLVRDQESVDAVRGALGRLFENFTLHALRDALHSPDIVPDISKRPERNTRTVVAHGRDRYLLKPTVRREAIDRYLEDGHPVPERVALPYPATDSIPTQM